MAFTYDLLESESKLLNDYHVFNVFHVFPKCGAILLWYQISLVRSGISSIQTALVQLRRSLGRTLKVWSVSIVLLALQKANLNSILGRRLALGHIFLNIAHLAMSFDWFSTCTRAKNHFKAPQELVFYRLMSHGSQHFKDWNEIGQQILTNMTYFCICMTEIASFWECSRSTEGGKRVGWWWMTLMTGVGGRRWWWMAVLMILKNPKRQIWWENQTDEVLNPSWV